MEINFYMNGTIPSHHPGDGFRFYPLFFPERAGVTVPCRMILYTRFQGRRDDSLRLNSEPAETVPVSVSARFL